MSPADVQQTQEEKLLSLPETATEPIREVVEVLQKGRGALCQVSQTVGCNSETGSGMQERGSCDSDETRTAAQPALQLSGSREWL